MILGPFSYQIHLNWVSFPERILYDVDLTCQAALARGRYPPCASGDIDNVRTLCTLTEYYDIRRLQYRAIRFAGTTEVGCHSLTHIFPALTLDLHKIFIHPHTLLYNASTLICLFIFLYLFLMTNYVAIKFLIYQSHLLYKFVNGIIELTRKFPKITTFN